MILFSLGLLTGFVIPLMRNPRMELASHLEAVMNGMFLILLGLIWQKLHLSVGALKWGYALALFGTYTNWVTNLHAAIWGASAEMLPIAGVFIVAADRSPILCRYTIAGSLLYGFGVFIVMHLIVTPLSATPPFPAPTTPWLIEVILEHILLVGLPLGILVQRHADINQ